MNKIETFEQFLSTSSVQFSFWNYLFNLFLTALLAFLLGLFYNRYGKSLSNRKNFSNNFVLIAITTMIIISIVKSSLALSLGLVGALSIVRFRAAIKEPEELTYLFLTIAIGLGFGADQKMMVLIGYVFVLLVLAVRYIYQRKTDREHHNMIMTISAIDPKDDLMKGILNILKKYCSKINLKRFDEGQNAMEMAFVVEVGDFDNLNNAKTELRKQYDNLTVSFMDNNITL
ncbi:MAG: DUF4956 domain-containing protein [Cytophagales bacterium]|nr:DUF4956 domain-containing protein [Cytophagales bacterium]